MCGARPWLTYEFSPDGKEMHIGYYRFHNGAKRKLYCNQRFTYEMIKQVYQSVPGGRDDYGVINKNCGHWANRMYRALYDEAQLVNGLARKHK